MFIPFHYFDEGIRCIELDGEELAYYAVLGGMKNEKEFD